VQAWRSKAADPNATSTALIAAIGRSNFAEVLLADCARQAPIDFFSVYDLTTETRPTLYLSASARFDVGPDCFRRYQQGLSSRDHTFDRAKALADCSAPALNYWHASEFPQAHRDAIYSRHRIKERLSLVEQHGAGYLALNLYRYDHASELSAAHIDALETSGAALLACLKKHLEIVALRQHSASPEGAADGLKTLCPALTARELDTCLGLLQGMTYDGIAVNLNLSVATIKTYRARAFERLGIHSRAGLFALLHGSLRAGN
jgi:DNA-binding CsgD family transcriptional regulator